MALNIGVAGYGAMGRWHTEAIQRTPGLGLRSVFDITPACRRDAAKRYGCAVHDELGSFIADERLDAVVVATPSHAHVEPTLAALRSGKHVMCEKPLVRSEREAKRLFAAAEKAGRCLMTFQNRRFDGPYLTTRKALAAGGLGELQDIRFTEWWYTDAMRTFGVKHYRPAWRTEAAYGGGALYDFGPHFVDQLLLLAPNPVESVYAILNHRRWTTDADDQFILTLRFAGGLVATVEAALAAQTGLSVTWAVNGATGGYRFVDDQGRLSTRSASGKERVRMLRREKDNWDVLYRNFRDVIRAKAEPLVKPRETLRLMRVLDAARRSAESGRVIAIKDEYAATPPRGGGRRK